MPSSGGAMRRSNTRAFETAELDKRVPGQVIAHLLVGWHEVPASIRRGTDSTRGDYV